MSSTGNDKAMSSSLSVKPEVQPGRENSRVSTDAYVPPTKCRVLAVVSHFKKQHIDYLLALKKRYHLRVAITSEAHDGAVETARLESLHVTTIGTIEKIDVQLFQKILNNWHPNVVHVMYYFNEELTILARRLADDDVVIIHECRDPLSKLLTGTATRKSRFIEKQALRSSDGQILVSKALCQYLENTHELDLSETSIVVPQCFADRTVGPPSEKLSAQDGRVHMALVGTASISPDHTRYYGNIIPRIVSQGTVVHSHFFESPVKTNRIYRELASKLEDYHNHPTISHRRETLLSRKISQYDLLGVFYELESTGDNEATVLEVALPMKAVCGWLHGGIPVVCFPYHHMLNYGLDPIL